MTRNHDARLSDDPAGAFLAASFSPLILEAMTGNLMRVAEAEFALMQTIMQAQFGMMELMMRAGSSAVVPHRSAPPHAERQTRQAPV